MPCVLKLVLPDFQLLLQQVAGMLGIIDEDIIYAEELWLVVFDDAGIRCDGGFTVGECVECVDGLVRGNIIWKMDDEVSSSCRHIFDLLNLDFSLVFGLEDGIYQYVGCLSIRYLLDSQGVLVDFLDFCPDFHTAASLAFHIFAAVCISAGREVRKNLELLSFQICYGCIYELIEVVREDFGSHSYGDSFRALCEQERKSYRQFHRFLVPAVVGGHPFCNLGVENDIFGKLAESGLDVSSCRVRVSCEDVTPVSLAVDCIAFLTELDKCSENGSVTMRVIVHGLADNSSDLAV